MARKAKGSRPPAFRGSLASMPAIFGMSSQALPTGRARTAIMAPIAKALSEADQQAIVTYYARRNPPPATGTNAAAPDVIAAGAELAERGAW